MTKNYGIVLAVKLLLEWRTGSAILEPNRAYRLGRDGSADIEFSDSKISRFHLQLTFKNNNWILDDLDSSNGTFLEQKKVENVKIDREIVISIGGVNHLDLKLTPLTNFETTQEFLNEETSVAVKKPLIKNAILDVDKRIRLQRRISIGRAESCNWTINDPNVSRNHAEIVQTPNGNFEIADLKSLNGTFVNGQKIRKETLSEGDRIKIGLAERIFTLDGLENVEGTQGTAIQVIDVHFRVKQKKLLNAINLNFGPRTLTAVIGPSGAGKSTFLSILTGRVKPTQGEIQLNGIDLHENFQELSQRIGFVPQADIIHTRLTVRQALDYGAKLRLPADTSKYERASRVNEVLKRLELEDRADLRIDKLSGGQRKRASIGLELLTNPEILVLDEPTSGLDPALDAHVMETLRMLADEGQTIVVVTHSIENLNLCDNVVLLASGGNLIYSGPSSSVFVTLSRSNWAEVFKLLAGPDAINFAQKRSSRTFTTGLIENYQLKKSQNFGSKVMTLSARYFKVIFSDRFYSTLLVVTPLAVGFISYIAGNKYGLGLGRQYSNGTHYNPYAQGTILVLILGAIFIGLSTGIQEIVKENPIRAREQMLGVSPLSYICSKILVLSLIVTVQTGIFNSIVLMGRPLPISGLILSSSFIELLFISVSLALCSMVMSLTISAFLTSNEQAMPSLVGITLIQIVLSGALPLGSNEFLNHLSQFAPSSWANNAFAASINLVELAHVRDIRNLDRWESVQNTITHSFVMLAIFSALFFIFCTIKVRRSR